MGDKEMINRKIKRYLLISTFVNAFLSLVLKNYSISRLLFYFFECSLIGLIFMLAAKEHSKQ